MTVVYKGPGCAPEVREIGNTLRDFQTCVGGYIETITLATDAVIICNEEGRLMGLQRGGAADGAATQLYFLWSGVLRAHHCGGYRWR